jgi:hypothetical protein
MPSEVGFYDSNPDSKQFFQGDVLRDIPFPRWPTFQTANTQTKWALLRPLRSGRLPTGPEMTRLPNEYQARARRDLPDAFSTIDQTEYVVGSCQLRRVMILTRSCSLDSSKKHVAVAPVTEVRSLPEEARGESKLADLRAGNILHQFYLPKAQGVEEAFVDLLKVTAIHRTFLEDDQIPKQLVVRLSSYGIMTLQHHLSKHFGKQFGFDKDDKCIQDGVYSCSACFHGGREVTKRQFRAGNSFGPCPVCGDQAAFVKLP